MSRTEHSFRSVGFLIHRLLEIQYFSILDELSLFKNKTLILTKEIRKKSSICLNIAPFKCEITHSINDKKQIFEAYSTNCNQQIVAFSINCKSRKNY